MVTCKKIKNYLLFNKVCGSIFLHRNLIIINFNKIDLKIAEKKRKNHTEK